MDATPAPVVAAVDHRGWSTVVEHAADEAGRRGAPVHVTHVEPLPGSGSALLTVATRHAAGLRREVTSSLATGAPLDALAAVAGGAGLVVVGRSAVGEHAHPYARSVTVSVASRSAAPVLSVPDGWTPPPGRPTVVVGVDDADRCSDVLAAAVDAARDRAARLVVLTATWRPRGAGSAPLTQVTDPGSAERSESALRAALSRYDVPPTVPVEVVVRHDRPGEALLAASRSASLLVLGRHETLVPAGSHLGPVARAVLCAAECPVLLAAPGRPHLAGVAAGHAVTVG